MKLPYVLIVVAYCSGIFVLSSSANPIDLPQSFPHQDKVMHALMFGGLAALVSTGIRRSGRDVAATAQFIAPLVFTGLYGMSDEIHQMFVPGRTADVLDLAADVAGAFIVQIVLCHYIWAIGRQERPARR